MAFYICGFFIYVPSSQTVLTDDQCRCALFEQSKIGLEISGIKEESNWISSQKLKALTRAERCDKPYLCTRVLYLPIPTPTTISQLDSSF